MSVEDVLKKIQEESDITRIADALERIADALEKMPVCPPVNIPSVWIGDPVQTDYTTTSGTTDESTNETIKIEVEE